VCPIIKLVPTKPIKVRKIRVKVIREAGREDSRLKEQMRRERQEP
jgi:hypothetical protein